MLQYKLKNRIKLGIIRFDEKSLMMVGFLINIFGGKIEYFFNFLGMVNLN
jgi:hypothetical protein